MKEEIKQVLTMMQEGKIDADKASELLTVIKPQETEISTKPYLDKTLRIRVHSHEGDNVAINLPIKLIKATIKAAQGAFLKIPETEKYLKDVDLDLLLQAIEHEIDGPIIDITSAEQDKVFVVIE
ncbi:hypothetical protein [Bacillus sp. 165]|uniref:hypothetical protein n=1 Tax=Bacillus sp. 165 TaxID=1529117 RepID=UPI001ADB38D5|nr:hypothetical protein [Bacillus sp. 165]MBO9130374.1 hypothetical protein [Bacillus sp. 165]